jgi:hypothetical protein
MVVVTVSDKRSSLLQKIVKIPKKFFKNLSKIKK